MNIEVLFNYLKVCGKRILWSLHDCWAFTGHSAYCDAIKCTKWKSGCGKCQNLREYPISYTDNSEKNWIRKKGFMTSIPQMTIITPSHWLAELVKESFLSEYPVEVIHNGIDTDLFKPTENDFKEFYGIQDKIMILGVATAWNDMKGLSDFIKLASKLDNKFQIVLVGLTEKQISDLPQKIIGLKKTNSIKELVQIYSAADLYLNLSYCESFGLTNVEAQLCGTPIITYNSGGCIESAGNKGSIIQRGDLGAIVNAIVSLSWKKELSSEISIDKEEISTSNSLSLYLDAIRGDWKVKNQ